MIGFSVEGRSLFGRGRETLYSYTVLYQPLVNRFCRMRHEDASSEVGFGKDVGQRRGMVKMEVVL